MTAKVGANFFRAFLSQALSAGGSETTCYLDRITTLTGETLATADFTSFGKGTITIDPLNSNNIESCSFTGIDGTNIALTGFVRGLSAKDYTSSTSRAKYHPIGTTVIIAFGTHNLSDILTYIDNFIAGSIGNASTSVAGITKLSTAPVSPTIPIAVGDNDPRVTQYVVDTGSANAYAIAPSPAITTYTAGQYFKFKAANANTTTSTLAVNGLTTKTIKKFGSTNLAANDILSGQVVEVIYDGTNFQMLSSVTTTFTTPITRVYTSTTTWSKPAGLKYIDVEVLGAGGGGGGAAGNSSSGGGASGGYSKERLAAASLSATETVTVGTGGAGGADSITDGTTGGTSSFGTSPYLSATGGGGGGKSSSGGNGGSPGVGSNGDLNVYGGYGFNSFSDSNSSSSTGFGGNGGASFFGGGGIGGKNNSGGGNASCYGSGGGGSGGNTGNPGSLAGGSGKDGVVIVTEFY